MEKNPTEEILKEAEKWEGTLAIENKAQGQTKEIYDEESEEKIKYIPSPNFTDCGTAGTQLPINSANEAITILSKYRSEFDFVDYIKEKLNYNSRVAVCMSFFSEQIDALVLAIKQFESNKALILGDMAGIGKGRVVAGILRYAYQNKLNPVFVTEKENLFSEMYKDIMGIGGFGGNGGNVIEPKPFIMCPYTSDQKSVIKNDQDDILFTPLKPAEINNLLENYKGDFPFKKKSREFDFNCVFLTYNVISKTRGASGDAKRYFLQDISPKSIFVFDECHNASGRSKLGEWAKQYVSASKGVMFSSATFAKNPQAFPLYIIKTAMAEAQIDVTTIEKAIGVGGENVSEYISAVLVKEGQMIRRERDFSGCKMGTIYDGSDKKGTEAEEAKDKIYELYDNATKKFRDIYNYIKKQDFMEAAWDAVGRKASELKLDLANQDAYMEAKKDEELQRDFINRNKNKWIVVKYDTNTLGATTKFHFSENLLLASKAKFTADAVIKELRSEDEYDYVDGKKRKSNRKPVIALRATGESLFRKLNLKSGDRIQNDFGEYIRAVVAGVMNGKVVFRKVNTDLFKPKWLMEEEEKEHIEEVGLYSIQNEDLPDGGERLNELIEEVSNYNAELPLSTIDYLIDRIQSVQRAGWDKFGSTSLNYKVGEVTGRNYALVKEKGTDQWILTTNEREKSVKSAFNSFNSGKSDVLILNSSGSTGGSIHSSETFKDKRPRIMAITQVELDINTEVQKRGRINRSGQVNSPAYLYILSQIPSELRKYLSLKRKLRKLDANTSANQTQNSDLVGIKDKRGNPIADIFNIYGEEAFVRLLADEDNFEFRDIYDKMLQNYVAEAYTEDYAQEGNIIKALLQPFSREIEIYPCDLQEDFYDKMNILYGTVVEEKINEGTYQLELDIEDLRASLRSRVVKQLNNGLTEFSKPLFMEDKYCLERKRHWSKEKLDSEIEKMASNFYKDRKDDFQNTTKFHNDLLEDFEVEYDKYVDFKMEQYRLSKEPIRKEYLSQEEYDAALLAYETGRAEMLNRFTGERSMIYELLSWYKPNRNVYYPEYTGSGENMVTTYKTGKFVGYNFHNTSIENKYSKGSIYFKFAFTGGSSATAEHNISRESMLLQEIKRESNNRFSASTLIGGKTMGEMENDKINAWGVNPNVRRVVRFLSGNILSGVQLANNMDEIKRWSLVKYTNSDGSVSTSIRLDYPENIFELISAGTKKAKKGDEDDDDNNDNQIKEKIQVSLNNPNIIQYLKDTPTDYVFDVAVNTYRSKNVEPVKNGVELMVRGLIRLAKPQNDINKVFVYVFQANPDKRRRNEAGSLTAFDAPFMNNTNGNNPIFFAPFLNNYTPKLNKTYVKDSDTPYKIYNATFENPDGYRNKGGFAKVYEFSAIDTEKGEKDLRKFFDQLYNEQPISLEFPQSISDYFNVVFKPDVSEKIYAPKGEQKARQQTVNVFDEGEYEYKLEVDYDNNYQKSMPPNFIRYVKGKDMFDKGRIYLSQPILPTFARAYSIYPISLNNEDTVKLLLSIFTVDEKADFINQLTERAEKGESVSKIGDFVSTSARKRAVPDLKYIFGSRRTNDIGELLKAYALKGDISKLSYEMVEQTPEEVIKPTKKKTTITLEDAEKFVNYLLF